MAKTTKRKFKNVAMVGYDPRTEKCVIRTRHGKSGDARRTHNLSMVKSVIITGDAVDGTFVDSMNEETRVATIEGTECELDKIHGRLICKHGKTK